MSIFQAFLLGLVQGLTEFLPISSSGHLVLTRAILGIEGDYLFFDIMLHCATLLAVVIALWPEVLALFRPPFRTMGLLVIATIPAVISALVFGDVIQMMFASARYLAWFFALTAVLMFVTQALARRTRTARPLGLRTALCMGLAQAVAIFPGVSRSGSTIAGGVLAGTERKSLASFCFLMSIPVILGGVVLESFGGSIVLSTPPLALAVGVCTAFGSGLLAIKLMLGLIKRANYQWFGLYLLAISVVSFVMFSL